MKSSDSGIISTLRRKNEIDFDNMELNDRDAMKFRVHMRSKYGTLHECNYDNFYINGIFMDTFRFKDITKDVTATDKCAIFAVSSGRVSDRSSKILLRYLDKSREHLCGAKSVNEVKKRLEEAIEICFGGLSAEGIKDDSLYEANMSVAVFFKGVIVYAAGGNGIIAVKNKNKVKIFEAETTEASKKYQVKTYDINSGDVVVLCSDGMLTGMRMNDISYAITAEENSQEIAENLIKKTSYATNCDVTCITIQSEFKSFINKKAKIVMGLCGMITLANFLYILLG